MSATSRSALVIDDDQDLRKIISRILATEGLDVTEATNVGEAMAEIERHPPDIIFADLNIETESGFDFLARYREKSKHVMAPVIVMSVQADREAIQKAFSLGAREYLLKPVNAPLLLQKLRKVLKAKKFLTVEFAAREMPEMVCRVPTTITAACEVGFRIEAPARFAKSSSLNLEGQICGMLGIEQLPKLQTGTRLAKSVATGQFLSELRFVGMTTEQVKQMKELLKRWSYGG